MNISIVHTGDLKEHLQIDPDICFPTQTRILNQRLARENPCYMADEYHGGYHTLWIAGRENQGKKKEYTPSKKLTGKNVVKRHDIYGERLGGWGAGGGGAGAAIIINRASILRSWTWRIMVVLLLLKLSRLSGLVDNQNESETATELWTMLTHQSLADAGEYKHSRKVYCLTIPPHFLKNNNIFLSSHFYHILWKLLVNDLRLTFYL